MKWNNTQIRHDMGGVSARAAAVGGQFTPAVKRMMAAKLISAKQRGLSGTSEQTTGTCSSCLLALVAVVCSASKPQTVHHLLHITSILGYKSLGSITDCWQYH